jgi:hypothetical protein
MKDSDEPVLNPLRWAWLPGRENQYKISPDGIVWSFKPKGLLANRQMTTHIQPNGYVHLVLRTGSRTTGDRICKTYLIHRMVALAYIPNPDNKKYINHINGDKTDNRVENLEWCTAKENIDHAIRTGLFKPPDGTDYTGKLMKEDIYDIRMFAEHGIEYRDIAKVYPLTRTTIRNIATRKSWSRI